jgi:hypothetical protein
LLNKTLFSNFIVFEYDISPILKTLWAHETQPFCNFVFSYINQMTNSFVVGGVDLERLSADQKLTLAGQIVNVLRDHLPEKTLYLSSYASSPLFKVVIPNSLLFTARTEVLCASISPILSNFICHTADAEQLITDSAFGIVVPVSNARCHRPTTKVARLQKQKKLN